MAHLSLKIVKAWAIGLFSAVQHSPQFLRALLNFAPAPLEVARNRLTTCQSCQHLNIITRQCDLCGCFIALKVKWAAEKCPKGLWG